MKKHTSGKRFRATLGGGYKKEDVNAYIEEIQAEFTSVEATLKGQIDRQCAQVKAAEEATAAAKAEIDALNERIAALEAEQIKHIAVSAELSSLRTEYDDLRMENATLTSENTALVEKHQMLAAQYLALQGEAQTEKERLTAQLFEKDAVIAEGADAKDLAELREKAAAFDRLSADFGVIMLRANESAEAILRSAKQEADEMLRSVNAEISAAKTRAEAASEGIIGTLDGRLRKINADCRDDILAELEDLRSSVSTMLAAMKAKYADIGARIDHAKTEMQSESDRVLRSSTSTARDFARRIWKK